MRRNNHRSLLAQVLWKLYKWRTNHEIFDQMFPHLLQEANHGYPFDTDEEMNAQADEFKIQSMLNSIERRIRRMPKSYGECFRYIMHRELSKQLVKYEQLAKTRERSGCNPHPIATHA